MGMHFSQRGPRVVISALAIAVLAACEGGGVVGKMAQPPTYTTRTPIGVELAQLPAPKRKVSVGVYEYADQTGQQKPSDNFAQFSKAVTQGGPAILIDVLKGTGGSGWFSVVERVGLKSLLTERNLIDQTNRAYRGTVRSTLPPLRFAGLLLEGGIISYDTNTQTGGAGARFLGIGASTRYRRDRITVALRAVSVNSGVVMTSVTTEKTVYSVLIQGNVFRYVSTNRLLELEGGVSYNEPVGLAVRQAIQLAVYDLIMQGTIDGLWGFRDAGAQRRLVADYLRRKSGVAPPASSTTAPAGAAAAAENAAKTTASSGGALSVATVSRRAGGA